MNNSTNHIRTRCNLRRQILEARVSLPIFVVIFCALMIARNDSLVWGSPQLVWDMDPLTVLLMNRPRFIKVSGFTVLNHCAFVSLLL